MAADLRAAAQVDLIPLAEQAECQVEAFLYAGEDGLAGDQDGLGVLEFLPDALLFRDHQVLGDRSGDGTARQALALLLQLLDAHLLVLHLWDGVAALAVEFGFQSGADVCLGAFRHADVGGVVALDGCLDSFDLYVALGAAGAFVAANAEEVQVLPATSSGGFGQAQAAAAAGAEHTALEVVVVDSLFFTGPVASTQ